MNDLYNRLKDVVLPKYWKATRISVGDEVAEFSFAPGHGGLPPEKKMLDFCIEGDIDNLEFYFYYPKGKVFQADGVCINGKDKESFKNVSLALIYIRNIMKDTLEEYESGEIYFKESLKLNRSYKMGKRVIENKKVLIDPADAEEECVDPSECSKLKKSIKTESFGIVDKLLGLLELRKKPLPRRPVIHVVPIKRPRKKKF